MKVRYIGNHPRVEFNGHEFPRDEWVEVEPPLGDLPRDFEVKGKKTKGITKFKDLKDIDGVGDKTVEDLREIYGDKFNKLVKDAKTREVEEIPIRDDLAKKLMEKIGD